MLRLHVARRCISLASIWSMKARSQCEGVAEGWSLEEAAQVAYRKADVDMTPTETQTEALVRYRVLGLAPFALSVSMCVNSIFVPGLQETLTAAAAFAISVPCILRNNARVARLVLRMRIVPTDEDTPEGATVEVVLRSSITSDSTVTRVYALELLSELWVSDDGEWRGMSFQSPGGGRDLYQLSGCSDAVFVVPFLVFMKRDMEQLPAAPHVAKLNMIGATTNDRWRFNYSPDRTKTVPDVTVAEPFPQKPVPAASSA
eukprot:Rhum_TRINITY_DN25068_c0_g1::Rhum_TRINITY_DN25068_c0_g1_i1::g.181085::m.181085